MLEERPLAAAAAGMLCRAHAMAQVAAETGRPEGNLKPDGNRRGGVVVTSHEPRADGHLNHRASPNPVRMRRATASWS